MWDDLYYPPLEDLPGLPSHPKNYTWPPYDPTYFRPSEVELLHVHTLTTSTKLFSAEHGVRPWAPCISPTKHPLGPNRVPLDDLGKAIRNLPRYIPHGSPVLARNYSDYDAKNPSKPHGRVTHCHWCNRPFASLGVLMNVKARKRNGVILSDDPDQVIRHFYCCSPCHQLWNQYCVQFTWRVTTALDENRDQYSKNHVPNRRRKMKSTHKWNLNTKYNIRWPFLQRFSTNPEALTVNEIVPRLNGKAVPVTKTQRNKLRQQIYRDSEDLVKMAKAVLAGDHEWNSSQVQVFKTLMGKVLPDAHVAEEHTEEAQTLDNLSTEEIERLIAESEGGSSVIEHEPTVIHPSEDDDPNAPV